MLQIIKLCMVCVVGVSASYAADDCVPGTHRTGPGIPSPNERYRILNVQCARPSDDRAFVLLGPKKKSRRLLYSYGRDASAVWSPDSSMIAVNDYAGSDYTENRVLSADGERPPIDLKAELKEHLPPDKLRELLGNDHVYLSVTKWLSRDDLQIMAWGHGEVSPGGFCRCYVLSLASKDSRECPVPHKAGDPEESCEKLKK